jgi:exodeoxyribonuclease VII small subunit
VTTNRPDEGGSTAADGRASAPASGEGPPVVETLAFDDALAELQRTVAALEEGGLPLERTLELYERGAALHARCATLLDEAELRIRRLGVGPDGMPALVDDPGDDATWTGSQDAAAEEAPR